MLPKVAQIVATAVLHDPLQNSPENRHSFWATFVSKSGTKNFQKSHNLVTLSI